jgi:hypothetical protein
MLRVVALGPFPIPDELGLHPLPSLGIEQRRDPDRDPRVLGAPRAALPIGGWAIFEATLAIRLPDIPRLRAMVVGLAFIDGVPPDCHHTALRHWPRADFRGGMPCAVRRGCMA